MKLTKTPSLRLKKLKYQIKRVFNTCISLDAKKYSSFPPTVHYGCADSFATFISVIITVAMLRKKLYSTAGLYDTTAMKISGTKTKATLEE